MVLENAFKRDLTREMQGILLIAKAITTDMTNAESVEAYNKAKSEFINNYLPEISKNAKDTEKMMAEQFNTLFRGSDGKPRKLNLEIGESINPS